MESNGHSLIIVILFLFPPPLSTQIVLQIMASAHCEFMTYNSNADNITDGHIGLFVDNEDTDTCPDNIGTAEGDDDPYLRAARSMMTLSILVAACATLLVGFEWLCCRVCCAQVLESLAFFAAAALGALAYLAFGSEYCTGDPAEVIEDWVTNPNLGNEDLNEQDDLYHCSFGKGSSYNLVAILIYFVVHFVVCCTPKPTPVLSQVSK